MCNRHNAVQVRRATTEQERLDLWMCRKRAFGAIGRLSPSYITQDGVVARTRLPEMLDYVAQVAREYDVRIANVFHAGDGNIHPIALYDERDPEHTRRALRACSKILVRAMALGGSPTGEHGIGLEKRDHMPLVFSATDLDAQARLAEAFDPEGMFNPDKVLPTGSRCFDLGRPVPEGTWI